MEVHLSSARTRFVSERLSKSERLLLILWKVEQLSDEEIAQVLGLPAGLVISLKSALHARLNVYLAEYEGGHLLPTG